MTAAACPLTAQRTALARGASLDAALRLVQEGHFGGNGSESKRRESTLFYRRPRRACRARKGRRRRPSDPPRQGMTT